MQGPHQSFPRPSRPRIGTQISEHPSWSLGTRFQGHLGACMGSQSVFIDVFSVLPGVKLYKNCIYMLLGDPSVIPTCPWTLADPWQWQCYYSECCHQRVLGGPQQTVNWCKLGKITGTCACGYYRHVLYLFCQSLIVYLYVLYIYERFPCKYNNSIDPI